MDTCTLYHLRNQLQRRAVTKKVKTDPTSSEDFFLLVTTGHLLYAVMSAIGMSSLEDSPSHECYSDFANKPEAERKEIFEKTMREVLNVHLNIETITLPPSEESSSEQPSTSTCNEEGTPVEQHTSCNDSVLAYANEVFSLGLF